MPALTVWSKTLRRLKYLNLSISIKKLNFLTKNLMAVVLLEIFQQKKLSLFNWKDKIVKFTLKLIMKLFKMDGQFYLQKIK